MAITQEQLDALKAENAAENEKLLETKVEADLTAEDARLEYEYNLQLQERERIRRRLAEVQIVNASANPPQSPADPEIPAEQRKAVDEKESAAAAAKAAAATPTVPNSVAAPKEGN